MAQGMVVLPGKDWSKLPVAGKDYIQKSAVDNLFHKKYLGTVYAGNAFDSDNEYFYTVLFNEVSSYNLVKISKSTLEIVATSSVTINPNACVIRCDNTNTDKIIVFESGSTGKLTIFNKSDLSVSSTFSSATFTNPSNGLEESGDWIYLAGKTGIRKISKTSLGLGTLLSIASTNNPILTQDDSFLYFIGNTSAKVSKSTFTTSKSSYEFTNSSWSFFSNVRPIVNNGYIYFVTTSGTSAAIQKWDIGFVGVTSLSMPNYHSCRFVPFGSGLMVVDSYGDNYSSYNDIFTVDYNLANKDVLNSVSALPIHVSYSGILLNSISENTVLINGSVYELGKFIVYEEVV